MSLRLNFLLPWKRTTGRRPPAWHIRHSVALLTPSISQTCFWGSRRSSGSFCLSLKAAGVRVFTIGLGADADAALLREVASAPADYYESPAEADLATIYAQISERLACGDD